jgi:hypothetical protein
MAEPISSTIIGSLVQALLDIAAKRLPEFGKKAPTYATGTRFQELVYDLYIQVDRLRKEIGQLIQVFDLLSTTLGAFSGRIAN